MSKKKPLHFAILGLGTFGATLASELTRLGNHVLGMDIDERAVSRMANVIAEAVIADCRDEDALREAGVGAYETAIVGIGEDLEANILCVMHCKVIGVKKIWAKALNKVHHRILTKLDVDRVILPEQEIGQHIAQMLHNPLVQDYLRMGNGYFTVRIQAPERLNGRKLKELALEDRYDLKCLGMMRGQEYIAGESGEAVVLAGDQLLVLGTRPNLRIFGDSL